MPSAGSGRLVGMGGYDGVELDELVLHGPRLTLRPWRRDDADAVHAIMQDAAMHEFLALPDPYTAEAARRFVTDLGQEGRPDGTGIGCAMVETGSRRLVGSAALRLTDDRDNIGYWVAPAAQGHGYAAEATRVLADWAFAHGLRRLQLNCDVRNAASARTALAAGFRFEGAARDRILGPVDAAAARRTGDLAIFARLADDSGEPVAPTFAPFPGAGVSDDGLTLRVVRPEDATALHEQAADPVTVATGFTGTAPTPEHTRRRAEGAALDWLVARAAALAMVDRASGRLAGEVQLRQPGPPGVVGIGYTVHPDFRGRGYTARALRLLAGWAFTAGGFTRLELGAKTTNLASQKAAESAGFVREGECRARLRDPDGSYSDEVRFYLLGPATPSRP
jgi:RimJ/RimL family protein N-acetyltransferase